ncbi:hypothetical protein BDV95DRAFT_608119 [Massariosphaeria phaeospora]|uniref:Uncharacterized protein n=1 Tax=Massariosphaeria phaeospora TaxID=100035 RepID=A0A7C8I3P0_9PLEO|nr:hypothetical protein BDV95DRAFT_608119 [Massariosphaeria phaeospora]
MSYSHFIPNSAALPLYDPVQASLHLRATSEADDHDDGLPSQKHASTKTQGPMSQKLANLGWWWEAGAAFVAVVCTSLIVAILLRMNDRPLGEWPLRVQPNSLIALFSTIAKSALLVPLAECIGQLKWSYFEQPRTLERMEDFDLASRGPWGSLMFLWKTRGSALLASLGAIITVLLMGFESFTQQVIQFETKETRVAELYGWIHSTDTWKNTSQYPTGAIGHIYTAGEYYPWLMSGTLGTLAGQQPSRPQNAFCPSSECRVESYSTLSVCSTCETRTVQVADLTCNYTLTDYWNRTSFTTDNGRFVTLRDSVNFKSVATMCEQSSDVFPTLILSLDITKKANGTIEAGLSPDLDKSVYFGGKIQEKLKLDLSNSDFLNPLRMCYFYDWESITEVDPEAPPRPYKSISKATCFTSETNFGQYDDAARVGDINGTISECALDFCAKTAQNLRISSTGTVVTFLDKAELLEPEEQPASNNLGNVSDYEVYKEKLANNDGGYIAYSAKGIPGKVFNISYFASSNLVTQFLELAAKDSPALAVLSKLRSTDSIMGNWPEMFDRLAVILHDVVQSSGNPSTRNNTAIAYDSDLFVSVHWPWLIIPLSIVALAIIFLILTVVHSSRKPYLFKSSILPVLFHGPLGGDMADATMPAMFGKRWTYGHLSALSQNMRATLGKDEEGSLKLKLE